MLQIKLASARECRALFNRYFNMSFMQIKFNKNRTNKMPKMHHKKNDVHLFANVVDFHSIWRRTKWYAVCQQPNAFTFEWMAVGWCFRTKFIHISKTETGEKLGQKRNSMMDLILSHEK